MKRVFIIVLILLVFVILVLFNTEKFDNNTISSEVVISEENFEESLTTEVNLFFLDELNNIVAETKKIDISNLINNPYKYVINLLKEEESNEKRKNILNEEFEIINCSLNENILNIRVTNNFKDIYSENIDIVKEIMRKTLTQFKEITNITIEDEDGNIL